MHTHIGHHFASIIFLYYHTCQQKEKFFSNLTRILVVYKRAIIIIIAIELLQYCCCKITVLYWAQNHSVFYLYNFYPFSATCHIHINTNLPIKIQLGHDETSYYSNIRRLLYPSLFRIVDIKRGIFILFLKKSFHDERVIKLLGQRILYWSFSGWIFEQINSEMNATRIDLDFSFFKD